MVGSEDKLVALPSRRAGIVNIILLSAITLRKIDKTTDEICQAVYSYDLGSLPLEYVEMLPRFIPNEMELKQFKNYERSGKSFEELTSEDKFMWLVRAMCVLTQLKRNEDKCGPERHLHVDSLLLFSFDRKDPLALCDVWLLLALGDFIWLRFLVMKILGDIAVNDVCSNLLRSYLNSSSLLSATSTAAKCQELS